MVFGFHRTYNSQSSQVIPIDADTLKCRAIQISQNTTWKFSRWYRVIHKDDLESIRLF